MILPYLLEIKLSLRDRFIFKKDVLIRIITSFLLSMTTMELWTVIMKTNVNSGAAEGINTIKYMLIASSLTMLIDATPGDEITGRIISGGISRDLLYPVSLPLIILGKCIGKVIATFILNVVPIFVVLSLMYHINWTSSLSSLLLAILLWLVGYLIYFMLNLQIDMISFWWQETFYFHYTKEAVYAFLSGALIPLWYYPDWLKHIVNILPFKNIMYIPIATYLETIPAEEMKWNCINIGIWFFVFLIITYLIWTIGVKKTVSNGG
jgi:ABC-2 type transport system permease protein